MKAVDERKVGGGWRVCVECVMARLRGDVVSMTSNAGNLGKPRELCSISRVRNTQKIWTLGRPVFGNSTRGATHHGVYSSQDSPSFHLRGSIGTQSPYVTHNSRSMRAHRKWHQHSQLINMA